MWGRIINVGGALFLLIILAPLLVFVAILIGLTSGLPILFRQQRAGFQGQAFVCFKFRTMRDDRDAQGKLLPDSLRLIPLGRLLRSASLDELPELFNVLRGEMNLVGPRPLLVEYLNHYTTEQARRHEVRPGITGWAQIKGRNALDWEEKFKLDVWYVDHRTCLLDLEILLRTPLTVLKQEGIVPAGQATMPPFEGVRKENNG